MEIVPKVEAGELESLRLQSRERLTAVRSQWPRVRTAMVELLTTHPCLLRNESAYRLADRVPELISAMDWLAAGSELPFLLPGGIDRLCAGVMAGHLRKRCADPVARISLYCR